MISRRGQSTAEYAVVISVVIAAVVGMQLYVKRGMQGKMKQASDTMTTRNGTGADALVGTAPEQYEPYYTAEGSFANTVSNTALETKNKGGAIHITAINDATTRTGNATQGADLTKDNAWK